MAVAEASPALLFEETGDRRLAEIYAPCFTLILQLRAAQEFGDAEVLRRQIKDLLDEAEREAARTGVPPEDVRAAKFALVAFIDETILSSEGSGHWAAQPLQLELYDRYDAGEEFFDKLESVREAPEARAEVLEVYYLCLTLGFKGKYQLHEQEKRRILIEETFEELSRAPGIRPGVLAPHGGPRGQAAAEARSKLPGWVIAAFAVGIALLVYVGMSLYVSDAADDAAQAIEAVFPAEGQG